MRSGQDSSVARGVKWGICTPPPQKNCYVLEIMEFMPLIYKSLNLVEVLSSNYDGNTKEGCCKAQDDSDVNADQIWEIYSQKFLDLKKFLELTFSTIFTKGH